MLAMNAARTLAASCPSSAASTPFHQGKDAGKRLISGWITSHAVAARVVDAVLPVRVALSGRTDDPAVGGSAPPAPAVIAVVDFPRIAPFPSLQLAIVGSSLAPVIGCSLCSGTFSHKGRRLGFYALRSCGWMWRSWWRAPIFWRCTQLFFDTQDRFFNPKHHVLAHSSVTRIIDRPEKLRV